MFSHLSVPKVLFRCNLPVNSFHVVNSRLSHSSCYFLHPRIWRSSLSSGNNNNNNNNNNNTNDSNNLCTE